jgi:uncharacterized lipoprotein YajG
LGKELKMKKTLSLFAALLAVALMGGCEPQGPDLEKVEAQPKADLEAGAKAQSIDDWAKANPNNGAPGQGDGGK